MRDVTRVNVYLDGKEMDTHVLPMNRVMNDPASVISTLTVFTHLKVTVTRVNVAKDTLVTV